MARNAFAKSRIQSTVNPMPGQLGAYQGRQKRELSYRHGQIQNVPPPTRNPIRSHCFYNQKEVNLNRHTGTIGRPQASSSGVS